MAEKKIYIGSVGPYLFEDDELINDLDEDGNPTGDFSGVYRHALVSDRQLFITEEPTLDNHLMRHIDSLVGIINYRIATGVSITIGDYKQIITAEEYIIEGTGVININDSGLLAVH